MSEVTIKSIESKIYFIRGLKVMLDSDLAELYGVETKRLKEQVNRNISRFPEDFMIIPDNNELNDLRSQIATLGHLTTRIHITHNPYLFTENGIAMLSSVLRSERAIQVNIAIMRIFTKLRSFLVLENELREEMKDLKDGTSKLFKNVFERMNNLEEVVYPKTDPQRKRIGLK